MTVWQIIATSFWCLCSFVGAAQGTEAIFQQIDTCLERYHQQAAFSGVALVAKRGELLYHKGFGYANLEQQTANSASTKFLIGSATKSFTAIAVMQCVEKGWLSLQTPIRNYLPTLNAELGQLTLHQLMKNSSGLPVHLNRITTLEYRNISSKELLELYETIKLSFTPGTQYEYSNLNYQLCALIVEEVSGMPYTEFLEQCIFKPLGMNDTGVQRTHEQVAERAIGYVVEEGDLQLAPKNYLAYAMGGGDIYATAADLLKWDQALYHQQLLDSTNLDLLFDGTPEAFGGYGYGFKIKQYARGIDSQEIGKLVRHGGSMYGFVCNIHRYLDDEVTIIILGNVRPYPVMEMTLALEELLRKYHFFE